MLPHTCRRPPAAGAAVAWLAVVGGAALCCKYALHVAATAPAAPAWMEATSKAMLGSGLLVKARPGWEHARACMRQLRGIVHRHAPAHCRPTHTYGMGACGSAWLDLMYAGDGPADPTRPAFTCL